MTRRFRALLAASALVLAAACASSPNSQTGTDDGASQNWLEAAWHWMFPPEAPPPPSTTSSTSSSTSYTTSSTSLHPSPPSSSSTSASSAADCDGDSGGVPA
jgi:hypothetical protein